jgi:serine protease AprX
MRTNTTVLGIWAATAGVALTLAAGPAALAGPVSARAPAGAAATREQAASYIVQAGTLHAAKAAVQAAGGRITHELGIINGVAATLSPAQVQTLRADTALEVQQDGAAKVMGYAGTPYTTAHTGADQLHASGITGRGVTVAYLDTGLWPNTPLAKNSAGQGTFLAGYDAISNKLGTATVNDSNGHGTHIVSIAANSARDTTGRFIGVAPDSAKVVVEAFDLNGRGTYADVIRGLDWILANRATYNIRVLNLSFGATAQSAYWNDPVNKAVMKLWQAGVVVVASAGNWGPYAQSITVPGNTPYVITVGAMTDNYTPSNRADDRLASFSSTGPTYEGFVKPEVVAPGGHLSGIMNKTGVIAKAHPDFHDNDKYFMMSGTSQAAAAVSGVVALMLQAQPSLTPDQVKCKLMTSARPAVDGAGSPSYTVFQQGAGQVNAYDAVYAADTTCANVGLNIAADLAGTQHFGGPARQDAVSGDFYLVDETGQAVAQQGYTWKNSYAWNQGYFWKKDYAWNQGYIWKKGNAWNQGYIWKNGTIWNQSFVPATSSYSGVNHWVDQE